MAAATLTPPSPPKAWYSRAQLTTPEASPEAAGDWLTRDTSQPRGAARKPNAALLIKHGAAPFAA